VGRRSKKEKKKSVSGDRANFTIENAKKCTEEAGRQDHCPQTNAVPAFDQTAMMIDEDGDDGGGDDDDDPADLEQAGSVTRAREADSAPARSAAISVAAVVVAAAAAAAAVGGKWTS